MKPKSYLKQIMKELWTPHGKERKRGNSQLMTLELSPTEQRFAKWAGSK